MVSDTPVPVPVPLWIDNQPVQSDLLFPVYNHSNNTSITACSVTPDIAKKAVDSSHKAFQKWRNTSPWERRELFFKAAALLEERRDQVAQLLQVETPVDGFTLHEININLSIDLLRELGAQMMHNFEGIVLPSKQSSSTLLMTIKEPLGVQLAMAPWNASLFLGMRSVATPIACGNSAILKASELCPKAHGFLGQLFRDAGLPPGVLNIIQSRKEDAPEILNVLLSDDRIRKVNFTGSTAVGRIVAAEAAKYGKPALLELGGKSAQIVLKDADLDKAAQAAVVAAFAHHGQICMSTERILVHESIMDAFSAKLLAAMKDFPITPGATMDNPLRVTTLVEEAIAQGATYLDGSQAITSPGPSTLTPCFLTNVTRDMRIWNTETFAPVSVLGTFQTLDEAVEKANDSSYGLSASAFSANVPRALAVARRLESGAVHINSMTVHDEAHMAHGGVKASGWGRFGVPFGFSEFTQTKTITITDDNLGVDLHE